MPPRSSEYPRASDSSETATAHLDAKLILDANKLHFDALHEHGILSLFDGTRGRREDALGKLRAEYQNKKGKVFGTTSSKGELTGFLALKKNDDGSATIEHILLAHHDAAAVRELMEQASLYLKEKGITKVQVHMPKKYGDLRDIMKTFGLYGDGDEMRTTSMKYADAA